MRDFANLYSELDASTSTSAKVAALKRYFAAAERAGAEADAAWAVYFLAGGKPRQTVPTRVLRDAARSAAGLPEWLFEESYQAVGDLAETIAHVLPPGDDTDASGLAEWIEQRLLTLKGLPPAEVEARLHEYWSRLDWQGRFLLTKLIGGGFRVGVSKLLVTRALAEHAGLDAKRVAQRLMGWTTQSRAAAAMPNAARYRALVAPANVDGTPDESDAGQPYPFFLAHPLQAAPASLGLREDWLAEWKWDGIRAQVVRRAGGLWIWSRGEELMTDRFPELASLAALPDGTVLDGELLVWGSKDDAAHEQPQPFAALQTRIGRKLIGKKILADAPVVFLAYDLLEAESVDLRGEPQQARRARLEALVAAHATLAQLKLSALLDAPSWEALADERTCSRARGVEGLMLKHRDAPYGIGRTKQDAGSWFKWKIDPMSIDAVLIYAQAGHGRRASLYTDYTFAVWSCTENDASASAPRVLVPFAKAYSGLSDAEIGHVDAAIRKTTIEKFGPVRSVTPTLVMELGFEGIQRSPRHKSGIAVRFPRILRLRSDKPVSEANTLADLNALLLAYE